MPKKDDLSLFYGPLDHSQDYLRSHKDYLSLFYYSLYLPKNSLDHFFVDLDHFWRSQEKSRNSQQASGSVFTT